MASKPTQPLTVTTSNSGVNVIIDWLVPASDGNAEITAYRVKFQDSNGVFSEETTNCDGTNT